MSSYCTSCGKATTQKADNLFLCEDGHENWVNPGIAAVVCIVQEGKILFGVRAIQPHAGGWALPGGFVNLNESLEEAAKREAREETGLEVDLQGYIGSYPSHYASKNKPVLNVVFLARPLGGHLKPGDDLAGGPPVWCPLDSLPDEKELAWAWYMRMWSALLREVSKK